MIGCKLIRIKIFSPKFAYKLCQPLQCQFVIQIILIKYIQRKNYVLNYFIIWSNPVSYAKLRPETEIKSRSFVQLRAVNNNEANKYKYIFRKFVHVE